MLPKFILAFTTASLLFTLLSWVQGEPYPFWERSEDELVGLIFHLLRHALLGGLVALPTHAWISFSLEGWRPCSSMWITWVGWACPQ